MFFQNYLPEMETHIWQKMSLKIPWRGLAKNTPSHVIERPLMASHVDMARDREATDGQSRGHGTL